MVLALALGACAPAGVGGGSGAEHRADRDAGPPPEGDAGPPQVDAGSGAADDGRRPPPAGGEACDGIDDDGDGAVDEGCGCTPGEPDRACYTGPAGTDGVGACAAGAQRCVGDAEFGEWTACEGDVVPTEDVCDDGVDSDCDGTVDEGCTPPQMPVQCTMATLTHVVGAASCAPNQAVYMMDDGDGPNFICCPLPARDILRPEPPVVRVHQCEANEVIVGATATGTFQCAAVNTVRYQLAAQQRPCYFGSGASGGSGVPGCAGHPHSFSVLHASLFGSDGCSGLPYGALFTRQAGDDCRDMAAAQLQYTGGIAGDPAGGTPVVMFGEE